MTDRDRLDVVAQSIVDAVRAKARGATVALPVIQPADAAALTTIMHEQLDEAISRRDAEIGERMACYKGCNSCCVSPVLVTEGESVAIAEWLKAPENAAVRAAFEAAYVGWRDAIGDLAGQGETADQDAHRAWMTQVLRRGAMCAFNHDGACSIYPVRPAICRKVHALYTSEFCITEDRGSAQYQHPETERLYDDQRPMRIALHKVIRPDHRLDLVCSAVARLLGI